MSDLHKTVLRGLLPPKGPSAAMNAFKNDRANARSKDYSAVCWKQYFQEFKDVKVGNNSFRVYLTPPPDKPDRPRLVVLHGGGYSGLTWSQFSEEVTKMVHCQVVAIDFRGHGNTVTDRDKDLSANTLTEDVVQVLETLYSEHKPPIVLIGHSMGGAIAVRVANSEMSLPLLGLAIIDVVEGTALESLSSMQSFLRSRPSHFKSVDHAIEWCVRSGQTRNLDSARVSMPGQIVNSNTGVLASSNVDDHNESSESDEASATGPPAKRLAGVVLTDSIAEEQEEGEECKSESVHSFTRPSLMNKLDVGKNYVWRINLSKTERYWSGWFQGLSTAFLECPVPKLLLLACISGLDRELTVGQMQGKFQMQVLPKCGHAVHEDCPDEVARVIATFLIRHKFTEAASTEHNFISVPGC